MATSGPVAQQLSSEVLISSSVFYVCGTVLISLTSCWAAYAALPACGKDVRPVKLALLCLSFGACPWAIDVLNKALVATLAAPTLVTCAQIVVTVIGTANENCIPRPGQGKQNHSGFR